MEHMHSTRKTPDPIPAGAALSLLAFGAWSAMKRASAHAGCMDWKNMALQAEIAFSDHRW